MNTEPPLEYDRYFHIYNKGINGENLFREKADYLKFLDLYSDYIYPVADTFAWCLMKNHFHLLVRIYDETEIGHIKPSERNKGKDYDSPKKYNPTRQFSHFFDAYSHYYKKRYNRFGGLFCTPFRRIKVETDQYFKQLVYYIHQNPVRHGFMENSIDWPWSSYLSIISVKATKLNRTKVIGWFNSHQEFIEYHQNKQNLEEIGDYIIEE
jgi:putative transposase